MATKYSYIFSGQTIETTDINSIPEGVEFETIEYELPDETVNPILIEKEKYYRRRKDGIDAVLSLISELRLNSITNNLPREVNKFIETKLERVRLQMSDGQWISAQEELTLVTVESYLTQALRDRVATTIQNYIDLNY